MSTELSVLGPDLSDFEDNRGGHVAAVLHEKQEVFFYEKTERPETGGIYVYKYGAEIAQKPNGEQYLINKVPLLYPEKGIPTPEAVGSANFAKRLLISQIKFFAKNPLAALSLLRMKQLERWIWSYADTCLIVLKPYLMQDIRYNNMARELMKFITIFLCTLGISLDNSKRFAKIFATLIEYDDVYRLRIEDLASETTAELFRKQPGKELAKLMKLLAERDKRPKINEHFGTIAKLMTFALWVPRIRRAFHQSMDSIDFTQLQYDDADRYLVLRKKGYDFMGLPIEERWAKYVKMHNYKIPKPVTYGE